MKICHLSHHSGTNITLDFVAKSLGHEIVTMPETMGWNYNVSHSLAEKLWNQYRNYFEQFDIIVTSDTAPLSRIFLQNNYQGKLIIWVANRFCYYDSATNDCGFPDQEYYDLFRRATKQKNVKIFSYTKFEHEYAAKYKNVHWNTEIIRPCAPVLDKQDFVSALPANINKQETFFIPPYHNDTIFMNLKQKCDTLGIQSYNGRYNGPQDLNGIKGIIHLPYGWAFLAIFENFAMGNVYYLPSKEFLLKLSKQPNFWWQDAYALNEFIDSAEFYLPEHRDLFIYFNDWNHLKQLTQDENLRQDKKRKVLEFSAYHTAKTLEQWKQAFNNWS